MKFLRFPFSFLACLFLVYCSDKKTSENVHSSAKTSDTVAGSYERGFVRDGEIMDVNFDPTIIGAFSAQTDKKIALDSLSDFYSDFKDLAPYQEQLMQFYKNRDSAMAWFDEDGLTEQGDHLAAKLLHLEKDGKAATLPYHEKFSQMMDNEIDKKDEKKIELMLTSQYLAYSKFPFTGKAAEMAKTADWLKPRDKFDALKAMQFADQNGGKIFPDEPKHQHYIHLKNKIIEFHKNGLDTITAKISAGSFKMGDSSAAVLKVRERLVLLGDLKNTSKTGAFDQDMVDALHRFQHRHGLDSANTVNKATADAMNVSGRETLEKMLINLERMRWMSPENGEYLLVNIPAYRLFAFKDADFLWDMDVIVGSVHRRTVVFSDKMSYIDFAPYWNIPPGIMKRKILPAMKKNPNYLKQHNMEKTGAMAAKDIPAVRQKPGPDNALGKAKFMFPNTYNIYLHDSNERNLFSRDNRDISSGCVRVSDAFKLAQFVLKDNKDIDDSLIVKKMNSGKENRVTLAKKMPVHLVYFTAWVDPQGNLIFSKDVYKRDDKLKQMMMLNSTAKMEKPEKTAPQNLKKSA